MIPAKSQINVKNQKHLAKQTSANMIHNITETFYSLPLCLLAQTTTLHACQKIQQGLANFVYFSRSILKCLLTLWHDVAIFTTS